MNVGVERMRCLTCRSTKGIHSEDGQWTCSKCGDEWQMPDTEVAAPTDLVDQLRSAANEAGSYHEWARLATEAADAIERLQSLVASNAANFDKAISLLGEARRHLTVTFGVSQDIDERLRAIQSALDAPVPPSPTNA